MLKLKTYQWYAILLFAIAIVAALIISQLQPKPVALNLPPPERTAFTPEVQAALAKSHGFQAFVSYTDNGFEPATSTIRKGETVRFTNNSSSTLLWVAARGDGGSVYPGTGKECGQSAFDTCASIDRGGFWEFTFDVAGSWSYRNNQDTSKTGAILVQ